MSQKLTKPVNWKLLLKLPSEMKEEYEGITEHQTSFHPLLNQ